MFNNMIKGSLKVCIELHAACVDNIFCPFYYIKMFRKCISYNCKNTKSNYIQIQIRTQLWFRIMNCCGCLSFRYRNICLHTDNIDRSIQFFIKPISKKSKIHAERLAFFLFWLPRYWEHRIAPPAESADSA